MKNLGMLLLAIYLIAIGVKSVTSLSFQYDYMVFGVLAIAAGVLLLMKK